MSSKLRRSAPVICGRSLAVLGFLAVVGVLASHRSAHAQDPHTVWFATTMHSVVEGETSAAVRLVLSRPADVVTVVQVTVRAGTAQAGVDFTDGSYAVHFNPGALDTSWVAVPIHDDGEMEDPETIELIIEPGANYEVGYPTVAQLVIVDDESSSLPARFEPPEGVPIDPLGRIVVALEPGLPFAIDVVVDDLPPEGGVVDIMTNTPDGVVTLPFDDDPRQTLELISPPITPGEDFALLELAILDRGRKSMLPFRNAQIYSLYTQEDLLCFWCMLNYALTVMGATECNDSPACDLDCPHEIDGGLLGTPVLVAPRSNYATRLAVLAGYRDIILLASPAGDSYVQLYRDLSGPALRAALRRPALIYRIRDAWDLWSPAIQAQVAGAGEGFLITVAMQDALLVVLDGLSEAGSPELASTLAAHRAELDLDHAAGRTAAELQTAIESSSLGNERMGWGEVKRLFR